MPIARWKETCSKCVYGSTLTHTPQAEGRCTHKHPKQHYDDTLECWMCDSFVRRWNTKQDIEKSKNDALPIK